MNKSDVACVHEVEVPKLWPDLDNHDNSVGLGLSQFSDNTN